MTKLKYLRISVNLSQKGLSDKTGVPRWKLSLGERGINALSPEDILSISSFFKTDPHSLLFPVDRLLKTTPNDEESPSEMG